MEALKMFKGCICKKYLEPFLREARKVVTDASLSTVRICRLGLEK
jgi:hypothetical protein